jgi:hypothetical protein
VSTAAFTKREEKGPPGDGREEIHRYDGEQREAATDDTREIHGEMKAPLCMCASA